VDEAMTEDSPRRSERQGHPEQRGGRRGDDRQAAGARHGRICRAVQRAEAPPDAEREGGECEPEHQGCDEGEQVRTHRGAQVREGET
jgi:hypothetical protein